MDSFNTTRTFLNIFTHFFKKACKDTNVEISRNVVVIDRLGEGVFFRGACWGAAATEDEDASSSGSPEEAAISHRWEPRGSSGRRHVTPPHSDVIRVDSVLPVYLYILHLLHFSLPVNWGRMASGLQFP